MALDGGKASRMKALVQDRYGDADVLRLADVAVPVIKDDEVLVQVRAASLNAADVEYLRGDTIVRVAGPRRPPHRIPGSDVAGVIVQVGPEVAGLAAGDEVFGDLFRHGFGAFAEYVAAPASALTVKPGDLTFEQVATLPQAGALAWQSLQAGRPVAPGDRVLISGAGGGVGTFAVQLAAAAGAEVTGVDRAAKEDVVRSLGATHYLDFEAQDYARTGERYDRIIDVQARRSVRTVRRVLRPGGRYAIVGGSFLRVLEAVALAPFIARNSDQRVGVVAWRSNDPSITGALVESMRAGELEPVIEGTYRLAEAREAFRRLAAGEIGGKAVIVFD
jgi:NADPH:quinone reductase-like Zn-dependent oxidoreductase